MMQMQAKIDAIKAQIDIDEATTIEEVIAKTLTQSLNTLQVDTTNCLKELKATMKQFVQEAVTEYAAQNMSA